MTPREPLPMQPRNDAMETVEFADVASHCTDRLQVVRNSDAVNSVALIVRGKRGRFKAAVWLAPSDARELARFILS